jgi:hypothetical protein
MLCNVRMLHFSPEAAGDEFLREVGNRLHDVSAQQTIDDSSPINHFFKSGDID